MIAFPNADKEFGKMQENLIKPLTEATCSSYGNNCSNSVRGRSLFTHGGYGLDLILAIDTSSSIGKAKFPDAIEFACSLIKKLGVSERYVFHNLVSRAQGVLAGERKRVSFDKRQYTF